MDSNLLKKILLAISQNYDALLGKFKLMAEQRVCDSNCNIWLNSLYKEYIFYFLHTYCMYVLFPYILYLYRQSKDELFEFGNWKFHLVFKLGK